MSSLMRSSAAGSGAGSSSGLPRTLVRRGIERFVAQVLPENAAMLHVFGDTGFEVQRRLVGGVVEVEFELTSSPEVLARIAERDHSAVAASLTSFFRPQSVAVIGALGATRHDRR